MQQQLVRESRDQRLARHEALRVQALREKKATSDWLGIALSVAAVIAKAFWSGILFLIRWVVWFIRTYPRIALALAVSAIAIWIAIWRYQQGFSTEDLFFLVTGLVFLLIGLRFTRRVLKENAYRYTTIGGSVMLGGAFMLYLGFF